MSVAIAVWVSCFAMRLAIAQDGARLPPFPKEAVVPQYLIERNVPGAGKLTGSELQAISQKSCGVLNTLGPQIQ